MNGKRIFTAMLAILLLIINMSNSNAQLLNLSVKGGYSLSNISGSYPVETEWKSGFNIYLSKDILSLIVVTVAGETGYTQKGFDLDVTSYNEFGEETGRGKLHYKLNYIELSALGKLRIPGGLILPYVLAGPALGFKVSSGVTSSLPAFNEFVATQEEFLKDFKTTSFGFKFGLGTEIGLPVFTILAEARYNPDLTTSYDKNNLKLKNKVFEFLVGVKF